MQKCLHFRNIFIERMPKIFLAEVFRFPPLLISTDASKFKYSVPDSFLSIANIRMEWTGVS